MLHYFLTVQIVKIKDIVSPPERDKFDDVYIVYELLDTDLHQIIRSSQALTDDHCQVCISLCLRRTQTLQLHYDRFYNFYL